MRRNASGIGCLAILSVCLGAVAGVARLSGVQREVREALEALDGYESSSDLSDPVHELSLEVASGRVQLAWEPRHGYLLSVLRELKAPVSSQTLVFSKTSEQVDLISPKTPRAIYMGEDVYVAWVQGSRHLELAAADARKGAVFYTLAQEPGRPPRFERTTKCIRCHVGPKTADVPGFFVRSAKTSSDGTPLSQVTAFVSGHSSPMNERWAGWYVTGRLENDVHLGNSFLDDFHHADAFDPKPGSAVVDLSDRFDAGKYPAPTSDIVAILLLDHSVKMRNLIAYAAYETRAALRDRQAARESNGQVRDWSDERIANAADSLLAYMLFRDEQPPKGKVSGTSSFAGDFARQGLRDRNGRSLRDLDLRTRLFVYPCSYLIDSPTFDGLPAEMKEVVWRRLDRILAGEDRSPLFRTLAAADRQAVREILLDTKPEFRAWADAHPRR
jgi:hypothetical protein